MKPILNHFPLNYHSGWWRFLGEFNSRATEAARTDWFDAPYSGALLTPDVRRIRYLVWTQGDFHFCGWRGSSNNQWEGRSFWWVVTSLVPFDEYRSLSISSISGWSCGTYAPETWASLRLWWETWHFFMEIHIWYGCFYTKTEVIVRCMTIDRISNSCLNFLFSVLNDVLSISDEKLFVYVWKRHRDFLLKEVEGLPPNDHGGIRGRF